MNSVLKKITKQSFYIFVFISLIMTILIIYDYSLILGWIVGSFASFIGFLISFFIINKFSLSSKTKIQGFLFGFLKTMSVIIFHGFILIFIIFINASASGEKIFWSGIPAIIKPINFYTYLSGIFLIPLATITSTIINYKKGKLWNGLKKVLKV